MEAVAAGAMHAPAPAVWGRARRSRGIPPPSRHAWRAWCPRWPQGRASARCGVASAAGLGEMSAAAAALTAQPWAPGTLETSGRCVTPRANRPRSRGPCRLRLRPSSRRDIAQNKTTHAPFFCSTRLFPVPVRLWQSDRQESQ